MVLRITCYTLFCIPIFLLGTFWFLLNFELVDFTSLEHFDSGKPSIVCDDEGNELFKFALEKREYINFDNLPKNLVNAVVAAEDHSFFSHNGVSIRGIIRSFLVNAYSRRVLQGASTITQQLVKLLFLSYDRTIVRKLKELVLALQAEKYLTKEQILELYVNNIYFGRGVYGVEAAAKTFWNKSISEVNLQEAALLAAIAKSAKFYSPLNSTAKAKDRRDWILSNMYKLNFINHDDYIAAKTSEITVDINIVGNPIRLYVQEWIRQWAERQFGKDALYKNGLKIKTSLNLSMQNMAEEIFEKHLQRLRNKYGDSLNGGMVAMEASSGAIKAFIGGYSFKESQFNRAFQSYRQMGSSFKPIVYSAALLAGLTMESVDIDEPFELTVGQNQVWAPRNWNSIHEGQMTLIKALTISNNIIAIKTLLKIGFDPVLDLAKKFGISHALNPYPSLALGTAESTVEENAAAFNIFANCGFYVKPYFVETVRNSLGEKIFENVVQKHQVLPRDITSKMVNALSIRMHRAKNWTKNWMNADSIGKTGSTNNSTTTWFVGSTPEFTAAVYVGFDDNKSLGRNVFATHTSYPIWLDFFRTIELRKKNFYMDPSLKEVLIDWNSGSEILDKKENIVKILK